MDRQLFCSFGFPSVVPQALLSVQLLISFQFAQALQAEHVHLGWHNCGAGAGAASPPISPPAAPLPPPPPVAAVGMIITNGDVANPETSKENTPPESWRLLQIVQTLPFIVMTGNAMVEGTL